MMIEVSCERSKRSNGPSSLNSETLREMKTNKCGRWRRKTSKREIANAVRRGTQVWVTEKVNRCNTRYNTRGMPDYIYMYTTASQFSNKNDNSNNKNESIKKETTYRNGAQGKGEKKPYRRTFLSKYVSDSACINTYPHQIFLVRKKASSRCLHRSIKSWHTATTKQSVKNSRTTLPAMNINSI